MYSEEHGALSGLPASLALEAVASLAVVASVWFIGRNGSFSVAFVSSLAGGLLLSRHSYLLDTAVLLPAAMTVIRFSLSKVLKGIALLLLVSPTAFAIGVTYPYSAIITGVIFVWLMGIAAEAVKGESQVTQPKAQAACA